MKWTAVLKVAPHAEQRYPTLGDWQYPPAPAAEGDHDLLMVVASELGDWRMELAIQVHELIEAAWCRQNRVTGAMVDGWDASHPDAEEPGELPGCPYEVGHQFGRVAEHLVLAALGVSLTEYDAACVRAEARTAPEAA